MTKTQTTERPVHPIADLFPMMTDEELANLAADIKANGLIHAIVVDKDGVIIDGRNRDRACEIAGIEPATVLFEGDDPRAYIIAANISRRHLTKGQQAMAVAMIYPVPEKGGRGKKRDRGARIPSPSKANHGSIDGHHRLGRDARFPRKLPPTRTCVDVLLDLLPHQSANAHLTREGIR